MRYKKYLLLILLLSVATHFAFFGHPKETVFDEVHFGKFVSGYFTGEYFFDIHPPLGKLIIAGMAKVSGFKPGFSFQNIGQEFQDNQYKFLRFVPSLFGTLLPLVVFLILLQLKIEPKTAFAGSLLVIFENALVVQSRFILLDLMLLFFSFTALLFFLKSRPIIHNSKFMILAGVFAALAASIKWTGLSFLGLFLIWQFIKFIRKPDKVLALRTLIFLVAIPILIYFSIFALHFSLLTKPGPGSGFHQADFLEQSIFEKFAGLNKEIYKANQRLTATHPYSSKWYEWPLMLRTVYFWNGSTSPQGSEKIYLIGNPVIWWATTGAVIYFFYKIVRKLIKKEKVPRAYTLLAIGFALNLLPFIKIGRVMFLYHYLPALVFAIIITVYLLNHLTTLNVVRWKSLSFWILLAAVLGFIFFSPLTYGFKIPQKYYESTVWLPSWR